MKTFKVTKTYRYEMDFFVTAESQSDAMQMVDDLDCSPNICVDEVATGLNDGQPSVLDWNFPYYATHMDTNAQGGGHEVVELKDLKADYINNHAVVVNNVMVVKGDWIDTNGCKRKPYRAFTSPWANTFHEFDTLKELKEHLEL